MAKTKWQKIRTDYITGELSQRAVAEKYGVSARQVQEKASKEGWVQKRRDFRERAAEKAVQKMEDRRAEQMTDQLGDVKTAADAIAKIIVEALERPSTINEPKSKRVDTRAIRNLSASLADVLGVLRDVYEIPNAIDKQKLEKGEAPSEIVVRIDGGGDDFAG